MQLLDLFETAEKDLERLHYARSQIDKFARWLHDANEKTPLNKIGMMELRLHTPNGITDVWVKKASDIGMAYQDLYIGIGYKKASKTTAFVTTGRMDNKPITFLIMLVKEDPSEKIDIYFSLNYSEMVHEFIHVMDYRRGYDKHRNNLIRQGILPKKDINSYYNSPIEFNAYYQQGIYEIMNKLTIKAISNKEINSNSFNNISYQSFKRLYDMWFNSSWMTTLTPENKKKFDRRFYKFYELVKNKWPDMNYIQDVIMEYENRYDDKPAIIYPDGSQHWYIDYSK